MKKNTLISILMILGSVCVILVVILILKGRGANNNESIPVQQPTAAQTTAVLEESSTTVSETEDNQAVEVDHSLFDVTVTLPDTFFSDMTEDEIKNSAAEDGIKEVTVNADGTVTYVMTKKVHNTIMDDFEAGILSYFEELKGEDYSSILDVEYNNDFSKITLTVDKAAYESSFDSLAVFGVGLQGMYYQLFDGKETHVEISTKDTTTGEVFSTVVYPDASDE